MVICMSFQRDIGYLLGSAAGTDLITCISWLRHHEWDFHALCFSFFFGERAGEGVQEIIYMHEVRPSDIPGPSHDSSPIESQTTKRPGERNAGSRSTFW